MMEFRSVIFKMYFDSGKFWGKGSNSLRNSIVLENVSGEGVAEQHHWKS